jgi:lysophospholipase L1-like esterase
METFAEMARLHRVKTLAVFGDSITVGEGATAPERSWASLLARELGTRLINKGLSGTVLQSTPVQDRRGGNGVERFQADLLGGDRGDCIAILYGYNDARYTADPTHFNVAAFTRDYRLVLDGLHAAGFEPANLCLGSPPYPSNQGLDHGSPGFAGQTRAGFEAYVTAVRGLAAEYGLFYAAVYEAMASQPDGRLASSDITHPNDEGHRAIATAFASALTSKPEFGAARL